MDRPTDTHARHTAGGPHFRSPGPRVELEITRGHARHKVRRVSVRAYLIGTASDCDLVLGDVRFPQVHAYLLRGPAGATIRWLGQGPELTVNGHVAHASMPLADGDLVRTGTYEFRVHLQMIGPRPYRGPEETDAVDHGGSASAASKISAGSRARVNAALRLFDGVVPSRLQRVKKAAS